MLTRPTFEPSVDAIDAAGPRWSTRATWAAFAGAVLATIAFLGIAVALGAGTAGPVPVLLGAALALSAAIAAWAYAVRCRILAMGSAAREDDSPARSAPRLALAASAPAPPADVAPGDVFAIERLIRRYYECLSGGPTAKAWDRLETLFTPGALVEGCAGGALPADRFVAWARMTARNVRVRETERTLHLVDDVAIAISAFEERGPGPADVSRGVAALRLKRSSGNWSIDGVTCRRVDRVVTLRRTFAPTDWPPPEPPRAA